jgi:hypothetical protein
MNNQTANSVLHLHYKLPEDRKQKNVPTKRKIAALPPPRASCEQKTADRGKGLPLLPPKTNLNPDEWD